MHELGGSNPSSSQVYIILLKVLKFMALTYFMSMENSTLALKTSRNTFVIDHQNYHSKINKRFDLFNVFIYYFLEISLKCI
jgi:hypothetical protein